MILRFIDRTTPVKDTTWMNMNRYGCSVATKTNVSRLTVRVNDLRVRLPISILAMRVVSTPRQHDIAPVSTVEDAVKIAARLFEIHTANQEAVNDDLLYCILDAVLSAFIPADGELSVDEYTRMQLELADVLSINTPIYKSNDFCEWLKSNLDEIVHARNDKEVCESQERRLFQLKSLHSLRCKYSRLSTRFASDSSECDDDYFAVTFERNDEIVHI